MNRTELKKWVSYIFGSILVVTLAQSVIWKISDPYTSMVVSWLQQNMILMPNAITEILRWLQMDIHTFISFVVSSMIVWTIAYYLVRREQIRSENLKNALLSLRASEKRMEEVTTSDKPFDAATRFIASGSPEHIRNVEAGALRADAVKYAKDAGVILD